MHHLLIGCCVGWRQVLVMQYNCECMYQPVHASDWSFTVYAVTDFVYGILATAATSVKASQHPVFHFADCGLAFGGQPVVHAYVPVCDTGGSCHQCSAEQNQRCRRHSGALQLLCIPGAGSQCLAWRFS